MDELLITPKTKILDLVTRYPELEEKLIEAVPAFEKLKNPLLRKTIARVTTLQQAAVVGRVKVEFLVNLLRKEAGQNDLIAVGDAPGYTVDKPNWFSEHRLAGRLDLRPMLERGEQPVHTVLSALQKLPDGGIYVIVAPFLPAPLIDKATGIGMLHWVEPIEENVYKVYFTKAP